jgi:hypothetical protein
MSEFIIANVLPGKLNALVKNIMQQTGAEDPNEAVRLVNSGEWVVTKPVRPWREEGGIIYFDVTSNGATGPEWGKWFVENKYNLWPEAKFVLNSKAFVPTPAGTTTTIAVLKGELFEDQHRITKNIRAKATTKKFVDPHAEVACLIRRKFSDDEIKAMGLWGIIVMHEPTKGSDGDPNLLGANRLGGGRDLGAFYGGPDGRWGRGRGFVFAVPPATPTV